MILILLIYNILWFPLAVTHYFMDFWHLTSFYNNQSKCVEVCNSKCYLFVSLQVHEDVSQIWAASPATRQTAGLKAAVKITTPVKRT